MANNAILKQPLTIPGRNGGMLAAGGQWGNKGGLGKPPSEVVRASKDGYEAVLALMERLVGLCESGNDETLISNAPMLIQLLDKLGKYGVGELKVEAPELLTRLESAWRYLGEELFVDGYVIQPGDADRFSKRYGEILKG